MTSAYVLLEDGTRFDGDACGAPGPVTGEVVFNTAMSGYQEAMSDPSYAGQLITFTYPHIGNYGVSEQAMESDRVHARAAIMRAAVNREDAPGAERPWLDWLADCGCRPSPAWTPARWCAISATRARCAAGCFPPTWRRLGRAS
jgi:carbamoyl-phosphate synthase small subunit